jgi:hypothetical protein
MTIHYSCPDCWQPIDGRPGERVYKFCGLSDQDHARLLEARGRAKQQAHAMMMQHRIDQALPEAIIKEIYDEAARAVKRGQV